MQYPTIAQPQYGFAPTMPMMPSMSDMPPAMMAKGGLASAAQNVQAQGRNGDSMLVHMTPREVGGLQALAMQHGGSLTVNPRTGLPEASFLKNLLPTVLGFALTPFMGPLAAGLTVGGVETVRTGDLGKGFLAGLGAFGGANLAGSLASTGASTAASAAPGVSEAVASGALPQTAASFAPSAAAPTVGETALQASFPAAGTSTGGSLLAANPVTAATTMGATLPTGYAAMGEGARALGTEAGREAFMSNIGGYTGLAKQAGMAAAPSLLAMPKPPEMPVEEESDYAGPYKPSERRVSYPGDELRRRTSEFTYFTPSNPIPYAEGGETSGSGSSSGSADVAVSPNEARVYQDILNVQRLAGLPALDPNRFAVMPGRNYEQFVYNPIEGGSASGGAGPERDYGFEPLGQAGGEAGGLGGMQFFMANEVESPFAKVFRMVGNRFERAPTDPSNYRSYTPTGPVDMADYLYDPVLGGYVKKSSAGPIGLGNAGFSKGGVPTLEDGGFVLTKKAVDGLGRGSNKKGQQVASRGLGAIPLKGEGAKRGPKFGVDDKIKTSIEGKRPALVSNGEAYVPKKQVEKHGGAKKFYALMSKAEKAAEKRKRA